MEMIKSMLNQNNLIKCLKNYLEQIETFNLFIEIKIGLLIEKTLIRLVKFLNIILISFRKYLKINLLVFNYKNRSFNINYNITNYICVQIF